MDSRTKNEISVKGDIVYLICHGKQDQSVVHDTVTQFLELSKKIKADGLTPKCLVDLSDNDGYDVEARNAAIDAMKKDAVPTAIVGTNTPLQTIVNFMTKLAGQSDKYQAFHTIEEGEKWLKSL